MILGNEWNSENCYSEADNHTKVIKILRKKHNQGSWNIEQPHQGSWNIGQPHKGNQDVEEKTR